MQRAHIGRQRFEMEKARMIGYMAADPRLQAKLTPKSFWPFSWEIDKRIVFEEQTPEQKQRFKDASKWILEQRRNGNNSGP